MLAARFYEPNKPLKLEEISVPSICDEDVLVKIRASRICGSETHVWKGRATSGIVTRILGHGGDSRESR
jgi:D-arabinose 1-dehydrogenase-like Zn-dependent alcohol dehydrogenase